MIALLIALAQAELPEQPTMMEALVETLISADFWFQVFVLVVCAPIWFPILKAIYRELDRSLRAEGGVFAREYTPREAQMLEQRDGPYEVPLRSVPRVDALGRGERPARRPAAGPPAPGARTGRTGRGLRSMRGRGF